MNELQYLESSPLCQPQPEAVNMRHRIIWSFLVMFFAFATAGAQKGENPYPEYPVIRDTVTSLPYSKPVFEKPVYWVRYWNASGYFAETRTYQSCIVLQKLNMTAFIKNGSLQADSATRHCMTDNAKANEPDGIAYDGHVLVNPARDSGKYFFRLGDADRYFKSNQVVDDPRLTNWWMSFALDSAATLRQAVEKAAMTKEFPSITNAILQHMVATGVVDSAGVDTLHGHSITKIMVAYTNSALDENVRRTNAVIGSGRLTKSKFDALQPGDKLVDYRWYRFGPYPAPHDEVTIVRKTAAGYAIEEMVWGEKKTSTIKWTGGYEGAKFVKVVHPKT